METYILILNALSVITIIISIVIILLRFVKSKITYHILIGISLIIILISSIINFLEHKNIIDSAEGYEQIISILFMPIFIFAIIENILQKEIRKSILSEQKIKGILDQTFSLIGLLDKEGRVLEVNKTAMDFAGYKDKKFIGEYYFTTKWWEGLDEEILKLKDAIAIAQSGKMARFETYHRDIDENIHFIDFSLNPVLDEQGNVIFLIPEGRDITEMKQAEQELEMYKNNLEKLVSEKTIDLETAYKEMQATYFELFETMDIIHNKNEELETALQHLKETQSQLLQSEKMASLGILTAGVAHEINNPLNYIMGAYMGLLRYYNENTFTENHEQVGMLMNALKVGVDRSTAIVRGLNQFSRKSDALDEDCNIHAIIDNSLTMLYNQIKHNITVDKEYFASDLVIKGNVGNLHQVFINILGNAIQAIETTGTIAIKTESEESNAIVKITDTGSGIAAENLKKITDPFFTTKDPGKGTGLGLSITYNIIKDHKGKIEFESKEGKGTTVKIILPKA